MQFDIDRSQPVFQNMLAHLSNSSSCVPIFIGPYAWVACYRDDTPAGLQFLSYPSGLPGLCIKTQRADRLMDRQREKGVRIME